MLSMETLRAKGLDLSYVIDAYRNLQMGDRFFKPFFNLLMGTDTVKQLIMAGKSADEIKATWQNDIKQFKEQRKPYLLYQRVARRAALSPLLL